MCTAQFLGAGLAMGYLTYLLYVEFAATFGTPRVVDDFPATVAFVEWQEEWFHWPGLGKDVQGLVANILSFGDIQPATRRQKPDDLYCNIFVNPW